jgi:hypothetical protein
MIPPGSLDTQIQALRSQASEAILNALKGAGPITDPALLNIVANLWTMLPQATKGVLGVDEILDMDPLRSAAGADKVNAVLDGWGLPATAPFLLYALTHTHEQQKLPIAARLAMRLGLIRRGFVAAGLLAAGYTSPLLTTEDGLFSFLGALSNPARADQLRDIIRREFSAASWSAQEQRAAETDEEADKVFAVVQKAYDRLNGNYGKVFNLITNSKRVAYQDLYNAYVQYLSAQADYLALIQEKVKQLPSWQKVYARMVEHNTTLQYALNDVFRPEVRTLRDQRQRKMQATRSVSMTLGTPIVEIPAANRDNYRVFGAVSENIQASLRDKKRSTGGGGRFLGAQAPMRPANVTTPGTYRMAHSPLAADVSIEVPAVWLSQAPFVRESTVIRFSPRLGYAILYRHGARVGNFSVYSAATPLDAAQRLLTEILETELVFRSQKRTASRSRMPIYVVQAGSTVAYPVFAGGTKSLIVDLSPDAIGKIVANMRINPNTEGLVFGGVTPVTIATEGQAADEAQRFIENMAAYDITDGADEISTEPLRTPSASPAAEPQEEVSATPILLRASTYEEGDKDSYKAIAAALAGTGRSFAVLLAPDARQQLQRVFEEEAKKGGAIASATKLTEEQISTTSVPTYVFGLSADDNQNTQAMAAGMFGALRSGSPLAVVQMDESQAPDVEAAYRLLISKIIETAKISASESRAPITADNFEYLQSRLIPVAPVFGGMKVEDAVGLRPMDLLGRKLRTYVPVTLLSSLAEFQQQVAERSNPRGRPRRNDGRRRRVEYVARAFQRVTS